MSAAFLQKKYPRYGTWGGHRVEQMWEGATWRFINPKRRLKKQLMEEHGVITGRGWRRLKKWLRAQGQKV